MAKLVDAAPGLRVPGCWNGFELAIQAILGRQTAAARLVETFGQPFCATGNLTHLFPSPEVLAGANLETIGLSKPRTETIRGLSRAVSSGRISFERIADTDVFLASLAEIPGIKKSTTQYIALRALGEPDAFPSGDPALEQRAEAWRPWRAYAAMYLWLTND